MAGTGATGVKPAVIPTKKTPTTLAVKQNTSIGVQRRSTFGHGDSAWEPQVPGKTTTTSLAVPSTVTTSAPSPAAETETKR